MRLLRGLSASVVSVAFSSDARRLAALSNNWQLSVWDLEVNRLLHILRVAPGFYNDSMSQKQTPNPMESSSDNLTATTPAADALGKPLGPYFGEYDENGVDLSLLRYMLSLTPRERVLRLEKFARDTVKLMEYGRRHREAQSDPGR